MPEVTRRQFASALLGAGAAIRAAGAESKLSEVLDHLLSTGIARRGIPSVVAMVATANEIFYEGAFGRRDGSGVPVAVDSIFSIASMTKPVTTAAAMQLVEQGRIRLDEPVAKFLPALAALTVVDEFEAGSRKARTHPARTQVTLRHLLTHTSGLAYSLWSPKMTRYEAHGGNTAAALQFEPGTGWQYGNGVDWAGRLIEKITGMTLEQYFLRKVTGPLGMHDTGFSVPENKFSRMSSLFRRVASGKLQEDARQIPGPPGTFSGGGGLYSTAPDFVRFMQMILRRGAGVTGSRVLKSESVSQMAANQIGALGAGKLHSMKPDVSSDVDFHPGYADKFGLGFLLNTEPYEGGRSAGSLAWAGIDNTYFWIDPRQGLCAVLLMQFLPFVDREAVGLLNDFERAVYLNA